MSQDMDFKPEPPPGFFSFSSVSIPSLPKVLRLRGHYEGSSQAWGQSSPVLAPGLPVVSSTAGPRHAAGADRVSEVPASV